MRTTHILLDECSPRERVVEVPLPEGYRRVYRGALVEGDLFLHLGHIDQGRVVWEPVVLPTRAAVRREQPYSTAGWYACVIRRGEPVDEPCERCRVAPREDGCRYCVTCRREVKKGG